MSNWTPDQERAIHESGQNIIVSAGAGSGKTAVLTERVITKLENTKINRLLINVLLNIKKKDMSNIKDKHDFVRVLAFSKKGQEYLNTIKKDINIYTNIKDGIKRDALTKYGG